MRQGALLISFCRTASNFLISFCVSKCTNGIHNHFALDCIPLFMSILELLELIHESQIKAIQRACKMMANTMNNADSSWFVLFCATRMATVIQHHVEMVRKVTSWVRLCEIIMVCIVIAQRMTTFVSVYLLVG